MSTLKLAWPHNWRKQKTLLTSTNYIRCTAKPRAVTVQNDYTADPRCYKKHQNSKNTVGAGARQQKSERKLRHCSPELNQSWNLTPNGANYHVNYKITTCEHGKHFPKATELLSQWLDPFEFATQPRLNQMTPLKRTDSGPLIGVPHQKQRTYSSM